MNKIVDFKINVPLTSISEYISKESQFNSLDINTRLLIEQELLYFFKKSFLTLNINIDQDDSSVNINPLLFNGNSIITDKNITLTNNSIYNNE